MIMKFKTLISVLGVAATVVTPVSARLAASKRGERLLQVRCFQSSDELRRAVDNFVAGVSTVEYGSTIGSWCVSQISDFSDLFSAERNPAMSSFNENIAAWDMASATNMDAMFRGSAFNQPIGGWQLSNLRFAANLFRSTPFNQDIGNWDLRNLQDMNGSK